MSSSCAPRRWTRWSCWSTTAKKSGSSIARAARAASSTAATTAAASWRPCAGWPGRQMGAGSPIPTSSTRGSPSSRCELTVRQDVRRHRANALRSLPRVRSCGPLPLLHWRSASFDPGQRTVQFEYSFPHGLRPYLITLRRDLRSPFAPLPTDDKAANQEDEQTKEREKKDAVAAKEPPTAKLRNQRLSRLISRASPRASSPSRSAMGAMVASRASKMA